MTFDDIKPCVRCGEPARFGDELAKGRVCALCLLGEVLERALEGPRPRQGVRLATSGPATGQEDGDGD